MICCRICRRTFQDGRGLSNHLARRHGIASPWRQVQARRQQAERLPCPLCPRDFQKGQGLSSHLAQAHGAASPHPKTSANRRSLRKPRARAPLPARPDGILALLEAVFAIASFDAHSDPEAAAWLRDVRQSLITVARSDV